METVRVPAEAATETVRVPVTEAVTAIPTIPVMEAASMIPVVEAMIRATVQTIPIPAEEAIRTPAGSIRIRITSDWTVQQKVYRQIQEKRL